jgi:DNA-binding FadR family transcriptional regulator
MALRRLKTQDLQDMIQEQIRRYILQKGMKVGDPLPTEKELSQRFGISRTAIREALRGLEAIGMIEARHGIGRFIRSFNFEAILNNLPYSLEKDIKNFNDILEIRVCLESSFLSKHIHKFTESDITQVKNILAKLQNQVSQHSAEKELIETHTEFHVALYRHTENDLLVNLIRIFSTIQRNLWLLKRYRTGNRKEFIKQHKQLIDAIETRDPALARQRMIEHFSEPIHWVATQKIKAEKEGDRNH